MVRPAPAGAPAPERAAVVASAGVLAAVLAGVFAGVLAGVLVDAAAGFIVVVVGAGVDGFGVVLAAGFACAACARAQSFERTSASGGTAGAVRAADAGGALAVTVGGVDEAVLDLGGGPPTRAESVRADDAIGARTVTLSFAAAAILVLGGAPRFTLVPALALALAAGVATGGTGAGARVDAVADACTGAETVTLSRGALAIP